MDSHLAACQAVIDELYDALIAFIQPLDRECLNWTPPVADANTIAALVIHTLGATDSWLARAVGESIERDRDAEFRLRATADDLVVRIERSRADTHRRLALLDGVDLGQERVARRLSSPVERRYSLAWCIEHAIIHAGEHWGHIQLTRQMYAQRS